MITNAWNTTKGFADSFSSVSMGTVALAGMTLSAGRMIEDFGVRYAGFAENSAFKTLKLGFALRLLTQPIVVLKSISRGLDAYEISDMTKVVTSGMAAIRSGLVTAVSAAVVLSFPLNALATKTCLIGSQVLMGSVAFLAPLIEGLIIVKALIESAEAFYFLGQLYTIESADERIAWIKDRLESPEIENWEEKIKSVAIDNKDVFHIEFLREKIEMKVEVPKDLDQDDQLRYLELCHLEIQKQTAILERALGKDVLNLVDEGNVKEIDSHLIWDFGKQILDFAWTLFGASIFVLSMTGILPFALIPVVNLFQDIDKVAELGSCFYGALMNLDEKAKAGDKALILAGAAVLTAVIMIVAFAHAGVIPTAALMVIALISASVIQYTYRKVVSDEQLQNTIEGLRELSRERERTCEEHTESLRERSA